MIKKCSWRADGTTEANTASRLRTLLAGVAAALLAAGCGPQQVPGQDVSTTARRVISDGAHQGNEHFFFLPPMVKTASYSGTFDGSLDPVVEVVESGSDTVVASFSTAGKGPEQVKVSPADEHYMVTWQTKDYALDPARTYRVRVLVSGQELGAADVALATSGKDGKGIDSSKYVALKLGGALPVKFRIEEGALASRRSLFAGGWHTCHLDDQGKAYCAGYNSHGQLGNGTRVSSATPVPVAGGHLFATLAHGHHNTCGITLAGNAYCWGRGYHGNLGTGTYPDYQSIPAIVTGGHLWRSIATGRTATCGVTLAGEAYCWGSNYYGELGTGATSWREGTPQRAAAAWTFQSISRGGVGHTCGLTTDGRAVCWGYNGYGQLGHGYVGGYYEVTPMEVSGALRFTSLYAQGYHHTCALTAAGKAYCWGYPATGGANFKSWVPQAVAGDHVFGQLASAGYHACGVTLTGKAICWGQNASGQVGDGSTTWRLLPVAVSTTLSFRELAAGERHTCGVATDDKTYCWGNNWAGQYGDGSQTSSLLPVPAMPLP